MTSPASCLLMALPSPCHRQVKCYMKQLLAGLDHCHRHGVLHRDLKGSNLLLNNEGELKIADFGLACTFDPKSKKPMTSQVITLWYRAPELLLGATCYGVGVDLWSAGCILAELLIGKPILPGRTEVEQLHRIFKLCGSPSEKYWKKLKLQGVSVVRSLQPYKCCIAETFKEVPPSAVALLEKLLAIDPAERGTAMDALNSEFLTTEPYACEPSSLPKYPPTKEMDIRLLDEKTRRERITETRASVHAYRYRRARAQNQRGRAVPAPEANAELQVNLNRWKGTRPGNAESKSEKFPPPHEDGAMGVTMNRWCSGAQSVAPLTSSSTSFTSKGMSMARSSFGDSERRRRR
ncbi:probable serine/threonine-protein kinase At1g54610 isoform X1 [Oryza brachyantha]|uniref:probable serine/threonine-protein kinase At1g54610 isoform X1 n=1 Tax=Oryza brachyantha TaxID=4533 RepID=UPI0007769648|nr:probable serine/threonine-protein kinase At1g54610 isoform X1 [Oryza brachyantha]